VTDLRFTRLRRAPLDAFPGAAELPDGGLCLSVFLVLEDPDRPGRILMGQVEPTAGWWELGGIDPGRLERIGDRWMLPSRQLRFYEGPDEAAASILVDQLGARAFPLEGPHVFSDPATGPTPGTRDPHWDVHFVYRGRWLLPTSPPTPAWRRLEFVDVAGTPHEAIARGQGDVLALVGLPPRRA
jgi:hypothetical protein